MTQARFELDEKTVRTLDIVKGKYGLKNRNEALNKFVQLYSEKVANGGMVSEDGAEYLKSDNSDYLERMQETVEVLSDSKLVKELNEALMRVESGEYLTEEEFLRNVQADNR